MRRDYLTTSLLILSGIGFYASPTNASDILILKKGGRVQGTFLVPPAEADSVYRFRTTDGVEITIRQNEIDSVERKGQNEDLAEYEKKREETPDTVEGNLELAHWCAEHRLLNQRKAHYERVLELDSENVTARRALGFKKMIDGKWRTSDTEMEDQGKVKFKGRWVSKQEKELLEKQSEEKLRTSQLSGQIKKWVRELSGPNSENALSELESLRDPLSVPGLIKAYQNSKLHPQIKKILIKCLGRIGTQEAINMLLLLSVDEKIEELRLTALDNLKPVSGKGVTEYLITRLSPKTSTNDQVNHAAYALGELGDNSAIPSLFQALVTTHKFQVVTGNQSGQTSAGMGSSSNGGKGMGFSMGSSVQTISQDHQNFEVLEALKKLTNENFSYDRQAWLHWYQQRSGGAEASIRAE